MMVFHNPIDYAGVVNLGFPFIAGFAFHILSLSNLFNQNQQNVPKDRRPYDISVPRFTIKGPVTYSSLYDFSLPTGNNILLPKGHNNLLGLVFSQCLPNYVLDDIVKAYVLLKLYFYYFNIPTTTSSTLNIVAFVWGESGAEDVINLRGSTLKLACQLISLYFNNSVHLIYQVFEELFNKVAQPSHVIPSF